LTTARVAPIRIERAWIGSAPGVLRNPTLWLFAGCVALVCGTAGGYLTGRLSAAAAVLLDTLAAYLLLPCCTTRCTGPRMPTAP